MQFWFSVTKVARTALFAMRAAIQGTICAFPTQAVMWGTDLVAD
jgi:hypothetical protein